MIEKNQNRIKKKSKKKRIFIGAGPLFNLKCVMIHTIIHIVQQLRLYSFKS